jgi:hypothetical protein
MTDSGSRINPSADEVVQAPTRSDSLLLRRLETAITTGNCPRCGSHILASRRALVSDP